MHRTAGCVPTKREKEDGRKMCTERLAVFRRKERKEAGRCARNGWLCSDRRRGRRPEDVHGTAGCVPTEREEGGRKMCTERLADKRQV